MSRLLIFDENRANEQAKLTISKLAYMFDNSSPTDKYIVASAEQEVTVLSGCVFAVGDNGIFRTEEVKLTSANLDVGANFELGVDYYIYICDPLNNTVPTPTSNGSEVYKISKSATYPSGFSNITSRKIGGFHYGRIRRVSSGGIPINTSGQEYGSGWKSNVGLGIVPNSVYTLKHRPKCNPEGMVYVAGKWIDIYLSSDNGKGGFVSRYNALPYTGTEGLNWFIACEKLATVGKELLDYSTFVQAAFGAPPGENGNNTNSWSATTNTARCKTGTVANAVSAFNLVDAVGNVWEWGNEISYRADGTSWDWKSLGNDALKGKAYTQGTYGLIAALFGTNWDNGELGGPWSSYWDNYPWDVYTGVGARGSSL